MKRGHQVLMWVSVILTLSLILLYGLHKNPADADQQSDTVPINLAGVANLLKSSEATAQESSPESQPITSINHLKKTPDSPADISNTQLSHSISLPASMRVYSVQENDMLWLPASRNNLDLYTLLGVNGMENQHLNCEGQRICISPNAGFCIRSKKVQRWYILNSNIKSL